MIENVDIYKAGGVLIKDRRLLVTRAKGKDVFVAPGGKLELGETAVEALVREMKEEVDVEVNPGSLTILGIFRAQAAGNDSKTVEMKVMMIQDYEGEPTPTSEVEELMWINSSTTGVPLGSIFEHDVIPLLVQQGLID